MKEPSKELVVSAISGWLMLPVILILILLAPLGFAFSAWMSSAGGVVVAALVGIAAIVSLGGFFTLQPNEARVLILFGAYKGTVREPGFHWANPFYSRGTAAAALAASGLPTGNMHKTTISLRARTMNSEQLKVNDKRGNPVEIAAVVVWHVEDTAMALFDVDNYETYVATQSETAIRHVASVYSYDHGADGDTPDSEDEITLRGNIEDVSDALKVELLERLSRAGVVIDDARLSHLAYAPEIAQAMLRRQQAEAIIAARRKIVTGAVSMVEMALDDLTERNVVHLNDDQKASLVSNLMVVLCGESEVHPIVNTSA